MNDVMPPASLVAQEAAARIQPSNYPTEFAARMTGRLKRPLGDVFGITHFGVNLTSLEPGAQSALRHAHAVQDEFIYVLEGELTLVTDAGRHLLTPGMCAGFQAGTGNAHHLINRSAAKAVYLEIGDRSVGDHVSYPDDDLEGVRNKEGRWVFHHKDGRPYD